MKRYMFVLAMALSFGAAPRAVHAQQAPEARIETARRQVQGAGIPIALLDNLVAEGRAKGVRADVIAAVVERRAAALGRAHGALRGAPGLNAADLSAGADAVEAGIGEETLRQVIARSRAEDRPVAIAVLTYLHREQGLPVGQALARVTEALGKGPEALRQLPAKSMGRPGGADRPAGAGAKGGRPSALPTPGKQPGSGKPAGVGNGNSRGGKGQGKGKPN